jgi:hypothetical protein
LHDIELKVYELEDGVYAERVISLAEVVCDLNLVEDVEENLQEAKEQDQMEEYDAHSLLLEDNMVDFEDDIFEDALQSHEPVGRAVARAQRV